MPHAPSGPETPRGINHLVLNVRDLEVSHRFWTEIMGFRQVAELKNRPFRMRFYSGVNAQGDVGHHDLALAEVQAAVARAEAAGTRWRVLALGSDEDLPPDRARIIRYRRPADGFTFGVRPKSPNQTTSVLSSMPRSDRSCSRAEYARSKRGSSRSFKLLKLLACVSQPPSVTVTK